MIDQELNSRNLYQELKNKIELRKTQYTFIKELRVQWQGEEEGSEGQTVVFQQIQKMAETIRILDEEIQSQQKLFHLTLVAESEMIDSELQQVRDSSTQLKREKLQQRQNKLLQYFQYLLSGLKDLSAPVIALIQSILDKIDQEISNSMQIAY